MNLNDEIFNENPRKPRGVSNHKLKLQEHEESGLLGILNLDWWVYLLMVMCLFLMCLTFNYIMKKVNDARLEERLAKLYDKNSQSTQVQITLLEIGNDKKSPTESTENPDPNAPGISLIFSKEENNKSKLLSGLEAKEASVKAKVNETVAVIEHSTAIKATHKTGPVIKDEPLHVYIQTKSEDAIPPPPEIKRENHQESITIIPVDRKILDYKDEGFKPFSRHSFRNTSSREKIEKTATVSLRTDEEDIARNMKTITPTRSLRRNQSMVPGGSKEDIGSTDVIKICRSREIKSKSSKRLMKKQSIPHDLVDCPFDPDEVSGALLDKLMNDIVNPDSLILRKIDESNADDEDGSRIEINSNN